MRYGYVGLIVGIILLGFFGSCVQVAGIVMRPPEKIIPDVSLDELHYFHPEKNTIPYTKSEEQYGNTPVPEHEALEVHDSTDSAFSYMAQSPYYKIFLKENKTKIVINNSWVEFELIDQQLGKKITSLSHKEQNAVYISNIFENVDIHFSMHTSRITEILTVKEQKHFDRIIYSLIGEGMKPQYEDDGSICFFSESNTALLKILPPFMKDSSGSICYNMHYALVTTESGFELHKIIDEQGKKWLETAIYPVYIDPSIETFEDAWESSGLQPYGQYFQNVEEHVNPANGQVTITQTDLTIPGRGLDLTLSRVYESPAVMYGSDPYEVEEPPVDIGKGWYLDLPYIGTTYVHLWRGTQFKIFWSDNQYVNVKGKNFILKKNVDNTYTLTTTGGLTYEFNTSGLLTHLRDVDQNTITFSYTEGMLTSITDTIGRTVTLIYSEDRLWKITYNGNDLEYSYDTNGCLIWMEDFLNRRTAYYYNSGYNNWLLSKIEYPTGGYTTYTYERFSDGDYYKYHVTDQRVFDINQVRHLAFSYTGDFTGITASIITIQDESDTTQGSYQMTIADKLISEILIKNSAGTPVRKYAYTYNNAYDLIEEKVYNDGTTLSFTKSYAYDNYGNLIYMKNAEGHEQFFSYANTDTSGFFVDNTGSVIKTFTNAFSNALVPSSVHNAILGMAERQDSTFIREMYISYDVKGHPTQTVSLFGTATPYQTYSGTFNEKTGDTSFSVDISGHTIAGNAILQISGLPSDDNYLESHTFNCINCSQTCDRCTAGSGSWQNAYFSLNYDCCIDGLYGREYCFEHTASIGPFTHKPGSFGYDGYFTLPAIGNSFDTFTVKTRWKAYPVQVSYTLDSSPWKEVSPNVRDTTATITVPITDGTHTLHFSESSTQKTKFSWTLYVPVDNAPSSYTSTMQYDTYGNIISMTDAESNTVTFSYGSAYRHAYKTEISHSGTQPITTKATYDYHRGWITSIQEPKGVDAGSGYEYVYTYDVLGRIIRKEFPLLSGQSQRSRVEAIYNCEQNVTTIIDQLGHYSEHHYDTLGRLTSIKWYTGTFGPGTLYALSSFTYRYDDLLVSSTDPNMHTTSYAYDFLGRKTHVMHPDTSLMSYAYDDTNFTLTITDERGFNTVYWYNWLSRLTTVEEEYSSNEFAVTAYEYDEVGHLTSVTDAESHTTTFLYDCYFGLSKSIYPDSTYEEYEYDSIGNLISLIDRNSHQTIFAYDTMYRLTQVQYDDQSAVSFIYDKNGNRISMQDDSPNLGDYVDYEYDAWNRLLSQTRHISSTAHTIAYEYDSANRLTALTYPDTMHILYTYDDLNRITEIKRYVDGQNDEILFNNAVYDVENTLTQFNSGNGLQTLFSRDSKNRITTITVKDSDTSFLDLDYTYDQKTNITQLINGWRDINSIWHSETESYSYDGLDRLTSASCPSWSHTYMYDMAGNRTEKDSLTYTINPVNEVTALSDGTIFYYDDNGNRTQKTKGDDTWDYTYDYANRLISVEKNDSVIGTYTYDGEGYRIQKTENDITTTYVYSGTHCIFEENSTGYANYIYGPAGLVAKRTTMNQESYTYYYHRDHSGSTRLVTDSNKNIISSVSYHPFGEPYSGQGLEHRLFTGKEMDSTDLYYFNARYYDPELGRFITQDSYTSLPNDPRILGSNSLGCSQWLTDPVRFNQYSYAGNNPLTFNDPEGLSFTCADPECEALLNPPPPPPPPGLPPHIKCSDPECDTLLNGGDGGSSSNPGNNPGNDPEEGSDSGDGNDGNTIDCSQCDCIDNKKIQGLLKQKSDWKKLELGMGFAYGAVCALMMASLCGPAAGLCLIATASICASLGTTIHESISLSLEDIEKQMYEAGCACAIWCG